MIYFIAGLMSLLTPAMLFWMLSSSLVLPNLSSSKNNFILKLGSLVALTLIFGCVIMYLFMNFPGKLFPILFIKTLFGFLLLVSSSVLIPERNKAKRHGLVGWVFIICLSLYIAFAYISCLGPLLGTLLIAEVQHSYTKIIFLTWLGFLIPFIIFHVAIFIGKKNILHSKNNRTKDIIFYIGLGLIMLSVLKSLAMIIINLENVG